MGSRGERQAFRHRSGFSHPKLLLGDKLTQQCTSLSLDPSPFSLCKTRRLARGVACPKRDARRGLLFRRLLPVLPSWLQRTSATATMQRQGAGVEDLGGTFRLLPLRLEVVLHNACHAGMLRWGTCCTRPPSLAILGLPLGVGGRALNPWTNPLAHSKEDWEDGVSSAPRPVSIFPMFSQKELS